MTFDTIKQPLHVFDRIYGDANFADFAQCEGAVGVHADLRRQIERHRKAGGPVRQQIFVAFVRLFRVPHAGVLAHGPESAAIHGGLDAAGERILAGDSRLGGRNSMRQDRREYKED